MISAAQEIDRFKCRMAGDPRFMEAWAEKVLADGSYKGVIALLKDDDFNLKALENKRPALAARLRFLLNRDRDGAAFEAQTVIHLYDDALSGMPRNEIAQLGLLAREIGDPRPFEARLAARVPPETVQSIMREIRNTPALRDDADSY
jgi:hypothetical protein